MLMEVQLSNDIDVLVVDPVGLRWSASLWQSSNRRISQIPWYYQVDRISIIELPELRGRLVAVGRPFGLRNEVVR